jgi:large subunit ribosomal protein L35
MAHKFKPHKGLLKRVSISGTGKVKFRKSSNGHLRSVKTGDKIRSLRAPGYAKKGDIGRLQKMLQRHLVGVDAGE